MFVILTRTVRAVGRRPSVLLPALLVLLFPSCDNEPATPGAEPSGPASVEIAAVQRHARQFDSELRARTAGSQQEFAAASYIVGHLQQAGYVARLDPVPVGNLVESSNVVALAPAEKATTIVVVPYDEAGDGTTIGLWLEIARSLRVAQSDHAVQLVALGAEAGDEGRLGTRRLIRVLKDDGVKAPIVSFAVDAAADNITVSGAGTTDVTAVGRAQGIEVQTAELDSDDVWTTAGFEHTHLQGPLLPLARILIEFLRGS